MNTIRYNYKWLLILLVFGFIACESDDEASTEAPVVITSGNADFSKFVSLGNSLTAGFTDGALFIAGQQNSIPNIMAQQFALAGGGDFTQPLMNDNIGGALLGGTPILGSRLFFNGAGPAPLPGTPTTEITTPVTGAISNWGVPGAKSFHLVAPGYGNVGGLTTDPQTANPYYVRMASSTTSTVLADAMAQEPTFFSLWIGNNDVLGYALSGGDGSDEITNETTFSQVYNRLVTTLTSQGAKGVVFNIPDVTTIAFFTTVPNNALELDATQAASLTGFFQAVVGIATQVLASPPNNLPLAQAQAIASQYAIQFNEGANRWIIDVPVSPTNPLGFRQMIEEELLVLTIDQVALAQQGYGSVALTPDVLQVLGILQAGGTPSQEQALLVLNAVNGLDDKDVLDSDEISEIQTATATFNSIIDTEAQQADLALVDANDLLKQVSQGGLQYDEFLMQGNLVFGGLFSLDGVHPTARGYSFLANQAAVEINKTYGSNLPAVKAADYPTFYSPMLP